MDSSKELGSTVIVRTVLKTAFGIAPWCQLMIVLGIVGAYLEAQVPGMTKSTVEAIEHISGSCLYQI